MMEQNYHAISDPVPGPPEHSEHPDYPDHILDGIETLRITPNAIPHAVPLAAPNTAPHATSYTAPYAAPHIEDDVPTDFAPDVIPHSTHDYTGHDITHEITPDTTIDTPVDTVPEPFSSPLRHEVYHRQSHSFDLGSANGQTLEEVDHNVRYETPPSAPHPQSISRPPSGLSGGASGERQATFPDDRGGNVPDQASTRNQVVIKVGMVGDAQIGKTSLMVKYVEGSWDEDYIQTLGVNFMEKTISIRNTEITFSIWDLGGQREFVNMLPLVCNDAVAILFMFDLTRKSTLNSIKEWYRQGRGFNKTAIPVLVGTKYDHFVNFSREEQEEISNQARRFAKAMRASLIFSSTSHSINVQKIFKIVLSKAFDLKCTIPEIENVGEPLLLYQSC